MALKLKRVMVTNQTRVSQHCISHYITVTVVKNSFTLVRKWNASVIKVGVAYMYMKVHILRH